MTGLLDLPLEVRNVVYEFLLGETLAPHSRAMMVVSENYIKERLPLRNYRGLLRTCRKTYLELKQAIQHLAASKQLRYELDITFSHGRPYFAMTWVRFPALCATINSLVINVDLRIREPFNYHGQFQAPHDHLLAHLIEDLGDDDGPKSFAKQLFDYIAILLKTLAKLLSHGNTQFNLLYTEHLVLNFRTPTTMVTGLEVPRAEQRRVKVDPEEADDILDTMQATIKSNAKAFGAFDASQCGVLSPLIQIGSLQFATEGVVWGEGHNLILAQDDFQWLQY
ncbi:hypothetical protein BU23DRAFT_550701 [Bimuria novae-zelandiae CBS 107.79]|uniref:F-box domain-containing protein n=1 Tax=Bimuria novae-zelandiae CBS 107.79 TaxID=1447943 RepID=A0A6A5VJH9_9PLEO|nr:hypothetical protein BU23DRAFT_550701 [Bimuria novae-zelandiae CBS 107.79]